MLIPCISLTTGTNVMRSHRISDKACVPTATAHVRHVRVSPIAELRRLLSRITQALFHKQPVIHRHLPAQTTAHAADVALDDVIKPEGASFRQERTASRNDRKVVDHIAKALGEIPPLPHVVRELLIELSDPQSSARSVARIAATDATLAAALIRTVNSAAIGLLAFDFRHIVCVEFANARLP